MSDMQASFQGLNIALTTAVPMPKLLGDFTHLLHGDDKLSHTLAVFARFQVGVLLSVAASAVVCVCVSVFVWRVHVAFDFVLLQEDLKRLADNIDARNAVSERACNSFNPRFLLCSVSI